MSYRSLFTPWRIAVVCLIVLLVLIGTVLLVPAYRRNAAVTQLRSLPGVRLERDSSVVPGWLRSVCGEWFDPVDLLVIDPDVAREREETTRILKCLRQVPELNTLSLPLADDEAEFLSNCTRLHILAIRGPKWTDAGMRRLPKMPELQSLDLSKTAVSDESLDWVSRQYSLTQLTLSGTNITNAGLEKLKRLKSLKWLSLEETHVDETAVRKIVGELPSLEVFDD